MNESAKGKLILLVHGCQDSFASPNRHTSISVTI